MTDQRLEPFVVDVPDEQLDELRARLESARLPEPETAPSQGVPLARLDALRHTWAREYDWRVVERELNAREQYRTEIGGLAIHVLVARSSRADARPLLVTHGWPGCVVEILDVLDALTEPPADAPAFHVVAPSLPGFGFSDRPAARGWGVAGIADAWAELMTRLGFERFAVQGGDIGSAVSAEVAARHPDRVEFLHTTMPMAAPPAGFDGTGLTDVEQRGLAETAEYQTLGYGYVAVQTTRPQTLGYALVESPIALLAWIADKFDAWTDWDDDPAAAVRTTRLLDVVTTYWVTATGASSVRFYWEGSDGGRHLQPEMTTVPVPSAVSMFPREIIKLPRSWVDGRYTDLRYWNELGHGGHFPSLEVPDVFTDEIRSAYRKAAPGG